MYVACMPDCTEHETVESSLSYLGIVTSFNRGQEILVYLTFVLLFS